MTVDAGGTLRVEPIERNVSYRHVAHVAEHWARSTKPRRSGSRTQDAANARASTDVLTRWRDAGDWP